MPNPTVPVEIPLESIKQPDAGALKAVQDVLADMNPDAPPAETPPAETPPADAPPADAPPSTPPADAPPADTPPAETPPADAPPVETPPVETPPARPSDEFGELPKDVKADTRERFDAMKVKYDAVSERASQAEATAQQWLETISSAGSPEQFGEALQVVRDVNMATPESWKRAYETLTRQAGILAKALGMPTHGYDPLDDHPDLKERVDNSVDFTRDDALLIAQARTTGKLQETARARESQNTEIQTARDRGIAEVTGLGARMRAADSAQFEAKLPYLTPIINSAVASLPPAQWVAAIEKAYAEIPTPVRAAATTPPAPVVPNSIRPSGSGSSGVDKKPASALEAMQLALARGG